MKLPNTSPRWRCPPGRRRGRGISNPASTEKARQCGPSLKQLKGFEPSTFSTASRNVRFLFGADIPCKRGGSCVSMACFDYPACHAKSRGLGTLWAPRRRASGGLGLLGGDVLVRTRRRCGCVRRACQGQGPRRRASRPCRSRRQRDFGDAVGGVCLVEHRSPHPVEDLDLAAQPIGEAETENGAADHGGLGDRESDQSSERLDRLEGPTRAGATPVLAQLP
jgi:hypothetical protein